MHFLCYDHRKLRLDALSISQGGRPEGGAYAAHMIAPFPTGLPADPECAVGWVAPQGFERVIIRLIRLWRTAGLATPVLEPILKCGWHHSLALQMATNFCVNVIHYGYDRRALPQRHDIRVTDRSWKERGGDWALLSAWQGLGCAGHYRRSGQRRAWC
jgi:hypothetical protein